MDPPRRGLSARLDLPIHRLRRALLPRALRARRVRQGAATPGLRRTLYIDLAVISTDDAGTGIQRVVRALALALPARAPPDWEIRFVAASRERPYHPIVWPGPQGDGGDVGAIRARPGDVFVGLDYALNTLRWHRRQLARFRRDGARIWFLVHDLLPSQRPDWFSPNTVLRNRIWLDLLAALGDGFLCNSPQTEVDLVEELQRYGLSPGDYRTCVLPMGHDIAEAAREAPTIAAAHPQLDALGGKPFLLKVGTLEPRKGHGDLLAAFDLLWASGSEQTLVFVGRLGWRVEALRKAIRGHPAFGRRLLWLEDVDDAQLIAAYRACMGVVIASRAEGFGLPLVEALGNGKPVLARDLPIFRMHAANGVEFFPADATPETLADHIVRWCDAIRDGAVTVRPPASGWQDAARILLDAVTRP